MPSTVWAVSFPTFCPSPFSFVPSAPTARSIYVCFPSRLPKIVFIPMEKTYVHVVCTWFVSVSTLSKSRTRPKDSKTTAGGERTFFARFTAVPAAVGGRGKVYAVRCARGRRHASARRYTSFRRPEHGVVGGVSGMREFREFATHCQGTAGVTNAFEHGQVSAGA